MATVGAALFESLAAGDSEQGSANEGYQIDDALIEQALAKLSTEQQQTPAKPATPGAKGKTHDGLPAAFRTLAPDGLENLNWKRFGKNLSIADIEKVDDKREVALQRLEPGAAVAHHDHRGREITVVLTGSFSDRNGQYYPGDFIVKEPGEQHRPTASENTSCVCLSVTEAPVKFTGRLTRLLNPVLAMRHPR